MGVVNSILKALYNAAVGCWNALITVAVELFTTSPKTAAGGGAYQIVHSFYNAIIGCTIPLATVFFIIALYGGVTSSPPEQQLRRFLQDAMRFAIIIAISTNLWTIMGHIMTFSDGITSKVTVSADECKIDMTGSDLFVDIDHLTMDDVEADILSDTSVFVAQLLAKLLSVFIYFIGGLVTIFVMTACGISIINVGFQRIIKPLIIMPFSAIVLGIGACNGEGTRGMWHFGKSFLGFCLSGAFMILAIKLGNKLCTSVITADLLSHSGDIADAVILTVQINLTVLITAGLCKSMDGMVSKVFG